jgi:uncharacterized RDD family membrane protein YckC
MRCGGLRPPARNVAHRIARAVVRGARTALLDFASVEPSVRPVPSIDPATPSLAPAPLFRRFAALCYDLLLLGALLFCFTWAVLVLRGGRAIAPGTVWFELALVALAMLFFCGSWTHGGQTLGMRAWRIRLVRSDGRALGWPQAALRFWAAVIALLPLGLGLWWGALDPERRGWHDRLARTRVVRATPEPSAPAPSPRP